MENTRSCDNSLIHIVARLNSSGFQATKDLENYDKDRHNEFKRYEMMKEHERREHLKSLSEEERRREEQRYKELRGKHAQHPKVNHPVRARREKVPLEKSTHKHKLTHYVCVCVCLQGSQDQLKEVWKETDGLDPEDFDPRTFFKLHGRRAVAGGPAGSWSCVHVCYEQMKSRVHCLVSQTATETASWTRASSKLFSLKRFLSQHVYFQQPEVQIN